MVVVEGRALIEPGQTRLWIGRKRGLGGQLGLELGLQRRVRRQHLLGQGRDGVGLDIFHAAHDLGEHPPGEEALAGLRLQQQHDDVAQRLVGRRPHRAGRIGPVARLDLDRFDRGLDVTLVGARGQLGLDQPQHRQVHRARRRQSLHLDPVRAQPLDDVGAIARHPIGGRARQGQGWLGAIEGHLPQVWIGLAQPTDFLPARGGAVVHLVQDALERTGGRRGVVSLEVGGDLRRAQGLVLIGGGPQGGALVGQQMHRRLDEDIGAQDPLLVRFQAVVLDQDGRHMGGRAPTVRESLAKPAVRKALFRIVVVQAEHQFAGNMALAFQRRVHRRLEDRIQPGRAVG